MRTFLFFFVSPKVLFVGVGSRSGTVLEERRGGLSLVWKVWRCVGILYTSCLSTNIDLKRNTRPRKLKSVCYSTVYWFAFNRNRQSRTQTADDLICGQLISVVSTVAS